MARILIPFAEPRGRAARCRRAPARAVRSVALRASRRGRRAVAARQGRDVRDRGAGRVARAAGCAAMAGADRGAVRRGRHSVHYGSGPGGRPRVDREAHAARGHRSRRPASAAPGLVLRGASASASATCRRIRSRSSPRAMRRCACIRRRRVLRTASSAFAADGAFNGSALSPLWIVPFAGILLSIAVAPVTAPSFWHHHFGKTSAFWALAFLVPFAVSYGIDSRCGRCRTPCSRNTCRS